jgi:hypothetical protein
MGPRAGLDGCGKYRLQRDSIPGPSIPQRVAIPTVLFQPTPDAPYVFIIQSNYMGQIFHYERLLGNNFCFPRILSHGIIQFYQQNYVMPYSNLLH